MKIHIKNIVPLAACVAASTTSLFAQLAIPSDGSDGALVVSNNLVIDLSRAGPGNWTNNNAANAGRGIYDPAKWAVVFKYSSVVISNGATLTYANHPTHAPVVWLVTGDVTINSNCAVSLDGESYNQNPNNVAEPGPGGHRGGAMVQGGLERGVAFGPGGYYNDSGSYATFHAYGNPQIVPLIGGSGAPGHGNGVNGSAGGGAILIAASGTITVNGSCHANAGSPYSQYASGGGVRMVANQILGNGAIQATGSSSQSLGRIRLEANTVSDLLGVNPPTVKVLPTPLIIWPETNAPTVKVISVASLTAPSDPKASLSANGGDLVIAQTNAVVILLQTANFPTNGIVNVYLKPRNADQSILPATFVSGNTNLATWQLTTVLPVSHTVIQARAVSN